MTEYKRKTPEQNRAYTSKRNRDAALLRPHWRSDPEEIGYLTDIPREMELLQKRKEFIERKI